MASELPRDEGNTAAAALISLRDALIDPRRAPLVPGIAAVKAAALAVTASNASAGLTLGATVPRRYHARPVWGGSSAGRASRSQCEGREFDPPPLHHNQALARGRLVDKSAFSFLSVPVLSLFSACLSPVPYLFCVPVLARSSQLSRFNLSLTCWKLEACRSRPESRTDVGRARCYRVRMRRGSQALLSTARINAPQVLLDQWKISLLDLAALERSSRLDSAPHLVAIRRRAGQVLSVLLIVVFALVGWRHGLRTPPARDMALYIGTIVPLLVLAYFVSAEVQRNVVAAHKEAAFRARRKLRRAYAVSPARCPTPLDASKQGHLASAIAATEAAKISSRAVIDAVMTRLRMVAATLVSRLAPTPRLAAPSRG